MKQAWYYHHKKLSTMYYSKLPGRAYEFWYDKTTKCWKYFLFPLFGLRQDDASLASLYI